LSELAGLPNHVREPDPSIYWSDNYVVLDFETTSILKGSPLSPENRIVLACWSRSDAPPMRHHFGSEYDLGELAEDISRASFVVAHNSKFELGWLKRCGVDLHKIVVFDTMIGEYVLGGNKYNLQHLSLNKCLDRHGLESKLNTVGMMIKCGVPVEDIPPSWLLRYCERDVEATGELFLKQREQLKAEGLEAIAYARCLVTPALADIEFNGVQLDEEGVLAYEKQKEQEYEELSSELQAYCEGASPASTKQMRHFIYDTLKFAIPTDFRGRPFLTPSGEPSTAAPIMEKLVAKTARQKSFLTLHSKWARVHADLTKYFRKFGECVRMDSGHLRAVFNQCATRTHRLSSTGLQHRVQFQNFSRSFKPYFKARHDGWLVGEADGAQLEFRVAAHLGRDHNALEDIISGEDIHQRTSSIIGVSRQEAKSHTFKPLYGGQSGTPEERAYYDAFKERYSGIADTQRSWTQCVLRDKILRTEWGLVYSWPDTRMTQSGYITNTTSIYNYPVQGLATAEIIPFAIVCAWHRMREMKSFMVNTVHDSIISELAPDEVGLWHDVAKQCLIEDVYIILSKLYGVKLTVPLGAGVTVGERWGSKEAKDSEIIYTADESLWKAAAIKEGMIDG
jgi:DNA polymerase I-like protein with 3'-5' exonuclease and polymerase domains